MYVHTQCSYSSIFIPWSWPSFSFVFHADMAPSTLNWLPRTPFLISLSELLQGQRQVRNVRACIRILHPRTTPTELYIYRYTTEYLYHIRIRVLAASVGNCIKNLSELTINWIDWFPLLTYLGGRDPLTNSTSHRHAPFAWSTTDLESVPDFKPVDTFDFGPIEMEWTLNKPDCATGADERPER